MKSTRKRLAAGLCLDPLGELKCSPDSLAAKRGKGRGKEREGEGRRGGKGRGGGGEGKGRKRKGGEELWTSASLNFSEALHTTR